MGRTLIRCIQNDTVPGLKLAGALSAFAIDPTGRACFDAKASKPVGSFEPNAFGLYDMAGNVFEWCGTPGSNTAVARGGSWSERDARFLCVYHRTEFPIDYRDADVGFRIVTSDQ